MMFTNENRDYLQNMVDEIAEYEKCLKNFDNWFKDISYNEVKNIRWYKKIESAVINHLAKKDVACENEYRHCTCTFKINDLEIYKQLVILAGLDFKCSESDIDVSGSNTSQTIEKKWKDAIYNYENNINTARKKLFSNIGEDWLNDVFQKQLDDFEGQYNFYTPAQFVYGKVKKKEFCHLAGFSYQSFGDNNEFRTAIFKLVKPLDSFKEKAKTKPEVDFYNLIRSEDFTYQLRDYFEKTNDERKSHKLKKLFSYVPEKSINATELSKINPKGYLHSVAYDEIHRASNEPLSPYYCPCSKLVFYSLVEFYGKDFFDKLPEKEKEFIRDFYTKHAEFKLSDPSIIKDSNLQNEKSNNLDKNLNQCNSYTSEREILDPSIKVIEKKSDNQNLFTDKDKNEILEINENENKILTTDVNVIYKEKSGAENLLTNKKEILITNDNTKLKSKKIKKSYKKAGVGITTLIVFFVISLILAWQISPYILIASAILLTMLIIYLIALKKNGFECTKIFCCCMDVENEPETEISKDNDLSNPKLDGNKMHIKS